MISKRAFRYIARILTACSLFLYVQVVPVFAQESEPSPADSPTGWIFRWLNFLIVLALIVYFFAKVAGPYFRGQSEDIARKIAEGTRAREAAEQQRRDVQAKLAGIDKVVAELRAEAKQAAEAEAARLRVLARAEAETIERAAQAEMEAAHRIARLELKTLAARLAIERAEALLRTEMTPQAESQLFGIFVEEVGSRAN